MNPLKRAFISLSRNLGRTILLFSIIFTLGSLTSGSISVYQAVQGIETNLRRGIPLIATVNFDDEALENYFEQKGEWPTPEFFSLYHAEKLGSLPYVERYYITIVASVMSNEIEMYDVYSCRTEVASFGQWRVFELRGLCNTDPIDMREEVIRLSSGRMFTEEEIGSMSNLALISEGFAALNNLHIGSSFSLEDIVWKDEAHITQDYIEDYIFSQRSYSFEVVGIFEVTSEVDTGDEWTNYLVLEEIANRIYVPNPVAASIQSFNTEQRLLQNPDDPWLHGNPEGELNFRDVYTFDNLDDMEQFMIAAQEIMPELYTITDLNDSIHFDRIVSPMESLSWLAEVVLWGALGAMVLILVLLLMIALRDRKREIGIYLALGEKKFKVISQITLEVLIVTFAAITLALFIGNVFAGNISESILHRDLIAAQDGTDGVRGLEGWGFAGRADATPESIIASYDVSLSVEIALAFIAVVIFAVIISTIIPMLYIVRLNPKKILM